ncbi:MFS transporter [Candidatus Tisiphia endosymbiont of Thecophora atra]|uniref:MFS transporter n=1 Tax=Candidatus Tisiphia endosymbiont of Thecophora atra TaxID=3066258 RepID=UPI00312CA426
MSKFVRDDGRVIYPQTSLTKEQKQAVGLLSIGTFLEYFDLMLYVHLAVLLNELFFPKYDPFTTSLLSAAAFSSTYILRPFGALLFGYIGDYLGRKTVVIITTFLMGISCVIIATLPTYAQIGITASWILVICRMIQGLSASAEACGAEIYLTESSSPPIQYSLVALITVFSAVGTTAALGVASIFTSTHIYQNEFSWRTAFWVGAGIALIGSVARTSLKETREFVNKKKRLKNRFIDNKVEFNKLNEEIINQPVPISTSIAYFFIQCARSPCFYFIYIYCGDILKQKCGFSANQVINQNFWVSLVDLFGLIMLAYLSYIIHPLKILKAKLYLFFASIILFPMVLSYSLNSNYIFIFQCLAALFVFDNVPATPIFYRHFPIFKRFTHTSILSAIAKLFTYFITSFGLVFTTEYLGYWGLFLILVPVGIGFFIGVSYFEKMEKQ